MSMVRFVLSKNWASVPSPLDEGALVCNHLKALHHRPLADIHTLACVAPEVLNWSLI